MWKSESKHINWSDTLGYFLQLCFKMSIRQIDVSVKVNSTT